MDTRFYFPIHFHEPTYVTDICFLCHEEKELARRVEFPVTNYLVREPTNAPQWVCWDCWNGPLRELDILSRIHPIPVADLTSSGPTVYRFELDMRYLGDDSDLPPLEELDTDDDMPPLEEWDTDDDLPPLIDDDDL